MHTDPNTRCQRVRDLSCRRGAEDDPQEVAMRVVKASAVQLSPVLYCREGTVEKVVRRIHELGQQGGTPHQLSSS